MSAQTYVVIAKRVSGERVYGPFESGPTAAGFGLNTWGPSDAYAAVKWRVVPVHQPADAEANR